MSDVKTTTNKSDFHGTETRIESKEPTRLSTMYRVFISTSYVSGEKTISVYAHNYCEEMSRIMGEPYYEIQGREMEARSKSEGWTKKELVETYQRRASNQY